MARDRAPLPVPRHRPNLDDDQPPVGLVDFGTGASIKDALVVGGDAATADWSRCALTKVEIADCRLTGLDLSEARLRDVTFRHCKLDYANLRLVDAERVRFVECVLVDADLGGARLEECVFDACDLTTADLSNAQLARVDLRNSRLDGIRGVSALAGATIDTGQLVALAAPLAIAFGVNIADDDTPLVPTPD